MLLRIPLAFDVTGDDVTDAAWESGWDIVEFGISDIDEPQIDVYESPEGVEIAHVVDPLIGAQYLVVEGDDITRAVAQARSRLSWLDGEDIQEMWDDADCSEAMIAATHLAGVSASASRSETWRVVNGALGHRDPLVRQAGVTAITYTHWPEWRLVLGELVNEDPDPAVAADAGFALLGLDQTVTQGEAAY